MFQTIQESTSELTIMKRKRVGHAEHRDDHQNRSKSFPSDLLKLAPSNCRSKFSMFSMDDSAINNECETLEFLHENVYANDGVAANDKKMTKTPTGKEFTRKVSMPSKDMGSGIELVRENDQKHNSDKKPMHGVKINIDESVVGLSVPGNETSLALGDQISISEQKVSTGLCDGNLPDVKPENKENLEERKRMFLRSIDEDILKKEKTKDTDNEVKETDDSESKSETWIIVVNVIIRQRSLFYLVLCLYIIY